MQKLAATKIQHSVRSRWSLAKSQKLKAKS
jgi:hypothetical protein